MSTTTVRLLKAASEIAGGNRALADRLGISEALLAQFMADRRQLPDPLLLRAVDIILTDRQTQLPPAGTPRAAQEFIRDS
jgi:hypothetical protein